jgi:hypothetical protein
LITRSCHKEAIKKKPGNAALIAAFPGFDAGVKPRPKGAA